MRGARFVGVGMAVALLTLAAGDALAQRQPPYWASIAAGKARMRAGPGRNFPASWLYQRADLPIKVIATYPNWRKIEDPDGTSGWMQANLLSEDRTAIVTGDIRPMRATPDRGAHIVWRAEPGVIGKISDCEDGWCRLNVKGRAGYVEVGHIWGVGRDEEVP